MTEESTPIPSWIIDIPEGAILIQSCNQTRANIAVEIGKTSKRRTEYNHVSLPDFVREWKPPYPASVSPEVYDRILQTYKETVLQRIKELNNDSRLRPR